MQTKRKILFNNYDTAVDGLWTLAACVLGDAEPVTNYISVPGRLSGPIDASTALTGDVLYNSRTLSARLESSEGTRQEREERINQMVHQLHGQRVQIRLPDDETHYLVGRLSIKREYNDLAHAAVAVSAVCEPWRYENEDTFVAAWLCGKNIFDNQNLVALVRNYCEAEPINSGVRCISKNTIATMYVCLKVAPVEHLVGQTITASYNATASGANTPYVRIGYRNADGTSKVMSNSSEYSGSVSLTVDAGALDNYDYVCLWLYSNNKGTAAVDDYIDYTNLQIELGAVATEYEAYTAGASSPVSIVLAAARRPVVPVVMVQGEVGLQYDGKNYMLGEGAHLLPDLHITQDGKTVKVSGNGAVTFNYRKAVL